MPDLPLQDLDNIRYPRRRPWVLVVIVAAVVAIWFWRENFVAEQPAAEQQQPAAVKDVQLPRVSMATPAVEGALRETAGTSTLGQSEAVASRPAAMQLVQQGREAEGRVAQDSSASAKARRLYLDALKAGVDAPTRGDIEDRLGRINVNLAFSPLPMPGVKTEYVVKSGDSVARISSRLGVTTSLLVRGNVIVNPDRIRIGDRYNILTGEFAIMVSKGRKDLLVTLNGEFFKRYHVATGKFGKTPTGTFEVRDKIVQPPWWRPDGKEVPYGDPENILGTRWMAIRATENTPDVRGYGIHGTWDDSSIGKEDSAGCIRMHNAEVEELYDLIPLRTPVTITD